jgi:hypothetical protein
MPQFIDAMTHVAAFLLSLLGGSAVVFALSNWLGGVWAKRILDNEHEKSYRERELIMRKRDIYARLAKSMRVLADNGQPATDKEKQNFLAAYDEAALWATDEVMAQFGALLDMLPSTSGATGATPATSQDALKAAYVHCITLMRKDTGFPQTTYNHRVVRF